MPADRIPVVRELRNPAHTGPNRCLPCTALNAGIALVLAGAVAVLTSPAVGGAVLAASTATIYVRGYLVPYTPAITRRYFPDRVLAWFGKESTVSEPEDVVAGANGDVERRLVSLGVVEADGDDIRLTASFADAWDREIDATRDDPTRRVADHLDLAEPEIRTRDGVCVVRDGGEEVTRWLSEAALIADVAAISALRTRADGWAALADDERAVVLSKLRLFLEECPACEGPLAFDGELDESSCCYDREVTVYRCTECRSLLTRLR